MKKLMIYGAAAIMALASCTQKEKPEMVDVSVMEEMNMKYQEANDYKDSLLLLMGDIYAGLDSINSQEGLLMAPGIGDNADRREEISQNLYLIRQRLEANRQLLAEMEKKANAANANSVVLQRTIEQMKARIEEQETRITELTDQLAQAQETISDLNEQMNETQLQLEDQTKLTEETRDQLTAAENDANTVYYVIGTNKQLKEYKVLEKKFLQATKIMQGDDIDFSCFVKADKRTLQSIPTGAKKVEIKSLNDKASYRIEGGKDDPKTIVITNPALFWQKTPYLVIEKN